MNVKLNAIMEFLNAVPLLCVFFDVCSLTRLCVLFGHCVDTSPPESWSEVENETASVPET